MLARSQTRTRTYASPSLIIESLQAPVPYDLQDKQTWRARPRRHSNSSARSFPGHSAKLFATCRLASATRQGAQVLTSSLGSAGGAHPSLTGRSCSASQLQPGQGHRDPRKPPHRTHKFALRSCSRAPPEPCNSSGDVLQLVNNPVLISKLC